MHIGELAGLLGLNPQTIRYYESIGLLPEPERTPSGYRTYGEPDVERLTFVRTSQRLGLTLAEIGEVLAFRDRGEPPCPYVRGVLDHQVKELDRRIGDMEGLRHQLVRLQRRARRMPVDQGSYCPILEHQEETEAS